MLELKVTQIQKVAIADLILKLMKVAKYLGSFCKKIFQRDISKYSPIWSHWLQLEWSQIRTNEEHFNTWIVDAVSIWRRPQSNKKIGNAFNKVINKLLKKMLKHNT